MTQEKVNAVQVNVQLIDAQEKLAYVKTIGEMFINYVCTVGKETELSDEKLNHIHLSYLKAIDQV